MEMEKKGDIGRERMAREGWEKRRRGRKDGAHTLN